LVQTGTPEAQCGRKIVPVRHGPNASVGVPGPNLVVPNARSLMVPPVRTLKWGSVRDTWVRVQEPCTQMCTWPKRIVPPLNPTSDAGLGAVVKSRSIREVSLALLMYIFHMHMFHLPKWGPETSTFVKFAIPGWMMSTPVTLPAFTLMVNVPENVPIEVVPETSNILMLA
jgi:hypothetical protein